MRTQQHGARVRINLLPFWPCPLRPRNPQPSPPRSTTRQFSQTRGGGIARLKVGPLCTAYFLLGFALAGAPITSRHHSAMMLCVALVAVLLQIPVWIIAKRADAILVWRKAKRADAPAKSPSPLGALDRVAAVVLQIPVWIKAKSADAILVWREIKRSVAPAKNPSQVGTVEIQETNAVRECLTKAGFSDISDGLSAKGTVYTRPHLGTVYVIEGGYWTHQVASLNGTLEFGGYGARGLESHLRLLESKGTCPIFETKS